MYEILSKLDNVEIYDFQTAKVITHNLDKYRDFTHYHQHVTKWMLKQIKSKQYLVNEINIDAYEKELLEQTENFNPPKINR